MAMKLGFYTLAAVLSFSLVACSGNKKEAKEDILVGELNVSVDESVLPLMLEQQEVFENSYYNAKVIFEAQPEVNAINDLLAGKTAMAVLTRNLTEEENKGFKQRSITPRIYPVAYDGIVLVGNISSPDTSITINEVVNLLEGNKVKNISLVFDNLNASIFRYFRDIGKLSKVANTYVEAANSAEGVLETVASNPNKVGLISYNQYLSLKRTFSKMDKIRILSVWNESLATPRYVKPSQASLSTEEYPLRRTIYIMNFQPNLGLGIGFSSFVTGDRGQRIVLKSGLLPATMPGREIIVRDGFN